MSRPNPQLQRWLPVLIPASFVLCLLALVFLYSHLRASAAPFVYFDGVFQTMAPLRRLMHGEIFFRDFVTYLGIGHTLVYLPLFVLQGGTLYASMFSAHFMACLCTTLTLSLYTWSVLRSVRWALLITAFFISASLLGDTLGWAFLSMHLLEPGVSGRPVRMGLPALMAVALLLGNTWFSKGKTPRDAWLRGSALGLLGAAGVFYSNDYGLPALVTLPFVFLFLQNGNRHRFAECAAFGVSAVVGGCLLGQLLTSGHLGEWFLYNFKWVAKTQFWYFEDYDAKVIHLGDWLDLLGQEEGYKWELLVWLPVLGWAAREEKTRVNAYSLLLFLGLTHFISAILVQFGSYRELGYESGINLIWPFVRLAALTYLVTRLPWKKWSSDFSDAKKWLRRGASLWKRSERGLFTAAALALCVFICFQYSQFEMWGERVDKANDFKETVAPYDRFLHRSEKFDAAVLERVGRTLDGSPVLAEYAGFDMVTWNRMSDSRADLLIHASGPERARIVDKVTSRQEQYITTISPAYNNWAQWNMRANWWFYRPLFKNYSVVAASTGYLIWGPREKVWPEPAEQLRCEWRKSEDGRSHISISGSPKGFGAGSYWAEVVLKVASQKLSGWKAKLERGFYLFDFVDISPGLRWNRSGVRIGLADDGELMRFPVQMKPRKQAHIEVTLLSTWGRAFEIESCDARAFIPISETTPPKFPWLGRFSGPTDKP